MIFNVSFPLTTCSIANLANLRFVKLTIMLTTADALTRFIFTHVCRILHLNQFLWAGRLVVPIARQRTSNWLAVLFCYLRWYQCILCFFILILFLNSLTLIFSLLWLTHRFLSWLLFRFLRRIVTYFMR